MNLYSCIFCIGDHIAPCTHYSVSMFDHVVLIIIWRRQEDCLLNQSAQDITYEITWIGCFVDNLTPKIFSQRTYICWGSNMGITMVMNHGYNLNRPGLITQSIVIGHCSRHNFLPLKLRTTPPASAGVCQIPQPWNRPGPGHLTIPSSPGMEYLAAGFSLTRK